VSWPGAQTATSSAFHEDVQVLAELGMDERDDADGVLCPYAVVHIDMQVYREGVAA